MRACDRSDAIGKADAFGVVVEERACRHLDARPGERSDQVGVQHRDVGCVVEAVRQGDVVARTCDCNVLVAGDSVRPICRTRSSATASGCCCGAQVVPCDLLLFRCRMLLAILHVVRSAAVQARGRWRCVPAARR